MSLNNRSQLLGHVGQDPEVSHLPNGNTVAQFTLATDESYIDKKGEKIKSSEWHNIVCWGKRADLVEKWVKKGTKLIIVGHLKTQSWDDKNHSDVKHYRTEIIVDEMQILSWPNKGQQEQTKAPEQGQPSWPTADDELYKQEPADDLPF